MDLIIVGAGRAGGSIALAAAAAGHRLVGVATNHPTDEYGPRLDLAGEFPEADAALVCVRDDQVGPLVEKLAGNTNRVSVVAHVSGFLPTTVLNELQGPSTEVGGFHPLQTLPDPQSGAAALKGSYVGIGGNELARDTLTHLGISLGMKPFLIDDELRPLYHAAAAAAANFVVTALTTSADLFEAADLDPEVAEPLVRQVVQNVFESGGRESLTGPIARGDTETVIGHLVAAHEVSEAVGKQFRLLAEATAILAGRTSEVENWK